MQKDSTRKWRHAERAVNPHSRSGSPGGARDTADGFDDRRRGFASLSRKPVPPAQAALACPARPSRLRIRSMPRSSHV